MSRADRAAALMRLEILNAKKADTFINRDVVFVTQWEDDQAEKALHLPHMKYFHFLSQQ